MVKTGTFNDLRKVYESKTSWIRAECEFVGPMAGGQPADRKGVENFVAHHLKLTGEEAERAVNRIIRDEIGDKDNQTELDELEESYTYGINIIRRDDIGPWIGNWMIHANLKAAASRMRVFIQRARSKGGMSEVAKVFPYGISAVRNGDHPERIYLVDKDGKPAQTEWDTHRGSVSTPRGRASIVHNSEEVSPGTRFSYEYRFVNEGITDSDIEIMLAASQFIGIGSVKSLGYGWFRILEYSYDNVKLALPKSKKKEVKQQQG